MKTLRVLLALVLLAVGECYGQRIGVQLIGGIPVSGFRDIDHGLGSFVESFSNYYIAGVSGELRISKYFGARVETLYRRVHISGRSTGIHFHGVGSVLREVHGRFHSSRAGQLVEGWI